MPERQDDVVDGDSRLLVRLDREPATVGEPKSDQAIVLIVTDLRTVWPEVVALPSRVTMAWADLRWRR